MTRKQTRCGHDHSEKTLRFGRALVPSERRAFPNNFDHWHELARSSLIVKVARLSDVRERARDSWVFPLLKHPLFNLARQRFEFSDAATEIRIVSP
jgi:hypothetical protein